MTLQLDKNRIVIRERSYADVLDLGLRLFRVYAWPLVPLLAAGAALMMALNHWLLAGSLDLELEPESVFGQMVWMVLLILWEAPLATAPATLFLGQAVFRNRPELRGIAKDLGRSLFQLLLYQALLRPWFVLWPYLNEVILLERNPIRQTAAARSTQHRARQLHRGEGVDLLARGLAASALGGALCASTWCSIFFVRGMLLGQWDWDAAMFTFYFPLVVWLVIGLFAVVRFLSYLDLRIRREGWEVELAMRAEQARLARLPI